MTQFYGQQLFYNCLTRTDCYGTIFTRKVNQQGLEHRRLKLSNNLLNYTEDYLDCGDRTYPWDFLINSETDPNELSDFCVLKDGTTVPIWTLIRQMVMDQSLKVKEDSAIERLFQDYLIKT